MEIIFPKNKHLRRLKIYLYEIGPDSYAELERALSIEGITNPGLDEPTRKLEMLYHEEFITKETILNIVVEKLGYRISSVVDKPA